MKILTDLAPYLAGQGLRIQRTEGVEIKAHCPAHPHRLGREDRSASFYFNQVRMVGHCFSCDWKVPTLEVLVEYLTGQPPDGDVVLEARKRSLAAELDHISIRKEQEMSEHVRYMEWSLAEQFRPIPAKLLELRRILRIAADFYQLRFDPEKKCQVIPIRSPEGQLWGWQRRWTGSIVRNWPAEIPKSQTLFGFHVVESDRVALVESPLDVVRLHQVGIPAVASFGAGVSNRQVELLARNFGVVVLALDNDPPGLETTNRLARQLKLRTGVVRWDYSGTKAKDPGDYGSDEELTSAWRRSLHLGF
jgi:hypothetical protein